MNFTIPKKYGMKASQCKSKEEKSTGTVSFKLPKLEFMDEEGIEEYSSM